MGGIPHSIEEMSQSKMVVFHSIDSKSTFSDLENTPILCLRVGALLYFILNGL